LRDNDVRIDREVTGGLLPRSVYLSAGTGRLHVRVGGEQIVVE
jgi:hypothetical protein